MAYPDAYARQYDYQSYQNLNPTRPLPADKVNADLNAVATFASKVVSFLSTSIRDDGRIMNGAVGYDQLSAELRTNSIAPATPWATATNYKVGNTVLRTGSIYRCLVGHTASDFASDLSAGYWTLVGALPAIDTSNTFAWTGAHMFSLAVGFANGSAAAPSIGFTGDTDTGFYRIGANNLGIAVGGSKVIDIGASAAAFTGVLTGPDGAVGAPAFSFTSDTDTGMYRIGANNIGLAVNGTKLVDIGTSGVNFPVGMLGAGNDIASGISRLTGTQPPVLMLSRLVNWSSINDSTMIDLTTLTAQDSVSNQYASFATVARTTNTAYNWNHFVAFEDLKTYVGSGTLTNDWSFLSWPTISGPVTNRSGLRVIDAGGVGAITTQYGVYIEALTRGTANWGIYVAGSTASYFGGNLLIGTSGVAPTTAALAINKNAAAPLAPQLAANLLQITNADGTGTNIELNAFGTGAVGSLHVRAARGTKAAPTAIQSGDTLTSWSAAGYGTSAWDDFTGVLQLTALENFTNTANGSAWDFYTNATGATVLTLRMRVAQGLIVGASGSDLGAGCANITGTTDSTTTATGALVTAGGLGVAKAIFGGTTLNINGVATLASGTATPAGGSTAARLLLGTTAGFGIYYGSGAPTVSAAAGSIYIRTDNAGANLRLYSNTTGSTTWAAITSA